MASPLRITSPKNPKLINAIKLRDSKHRRTQGLFLIDGIRSIELALESGVVIRELFVEESEVGANRLCKDALISSEPFILSIAR